MTVPVTIVAIDSVVPILTRMAIEDTLRQFDAAEVLVWSHTREAVPSGAEWVSTPVIDSLKMVGNLLWREVPKRVKTDHFLTVQWDGWAINGAAWTDDFLKYDYIGAPWWFDWHNVGNGGFSLRSAEFGRFLINRHFPMIHPEDNVLCRAFRPALEDLGGFKWPRDRLAADFSRERTRWEMPGMPFGFHGLFNFDRVLPAPALAERMSHFNEYVLARPEYPELIMAIAERMKGTTRALA